MCNLAQNSRHDDMRINIYGPSPGLFHAILADALMERIRCMRPADDVFQTQYSNEPYRAKFAASELEVLWGILCSDSQHLRSTIKNEELRRRISHYIKSDTDHMSHAQTWVLFVTMFVLFSDNYYHHFEKLLEKYDFVNDLDRKIFIYFHPFRKDMLQSAELANGDTGQISFVRDLIDETLSSSKLNEKNAKQYFKAMLPKLKKIRKILFPDAAVAIFEHSGDVGVKPNDLVAFTSIPSYQVLADKSPVVVTNDKVVMEAIEGLTWHYKLRTQNQSDLVSASQNSIAMLKFGTDNCARAQQLLRDSAYSEI